MLLNNGQAASQENLALIDDFWEILRKAAKELHSQLSKNPDTDLDALIIDMLATPSGAGGQLTDKTFERLLKAIEQGFKEASNFIDNTPDPAVLESLRNNVYVFSGFKAYQELRQATDLLIDPSTGNTKPFAAYLKDIRKLNQTYNEDYLRAEYNHAIGSAQMASIWADYTQDADLFDLQFDAINDERTRLTHKALDGKIQPMDSPFWDTYYPPLDWNCRCTVRKVRKDTVDISDVSKFTGTEIKPMFRVNTAKEGVIFPKKHPYYEENEANRAKNKSNILFKAGFVDENAGDILKIHPLLKDDGLNQEQAIAAIKNKQKESLYFFKNGKQIARFEGESNYVNPTEAQLIRMKDCTVIHNHPTSQSFSVEDIQAITRYDAKELIVSSPYYAYKVVRPESGWEKRLFTNNTLEESFSLAEDFLNKSVQRGEISYTQKLEDEMHEVWQLFFKLNNTYYERKKT